MIRWDMGGGEGGSRGECCGVPRDCWMMNVCVEGGDDGCLLSGGEGVRGGVVFAFFLTGLVSWGLGGFRRFLSFPFLGRVSLDPSSHLQVSFLEPSTSSTLHFLRSTSFCCILAWPSRTKANSGVTLVGAIGPALGCFITPALLRVETILDSMRTAW